MRFKRRFIAAVMTSVAVALSATLLSGALAVTTTVASAKSATTAKAKKHKAKKHKKKKLRCKKGEVKKGGKCVPNTPPPPTTSLEEVTEKGPTTPVNAASEIQAAPAFTAAQLNSQPTGNWISASGGSTGDSYSKLNEITTSNVGQLKGDWLTQLDGSAEATEDSGEATPVEYQGVVYYGTGTDDIFAVSVATGKILWVHKGELSQTIAPIVCCGWDNRGLSLGEGMVFSSVLSGSVEALNQKTGELVWKTEIGEPAEGFTVTAQPLYYEGEVILGPVGSEYGVRGFMAAYSAKTGALLWKHYNIPAPGEYGANTWPHNTTCTQCNNEWTHGGATVWQAPRVDPKLGLIYYSTANAGPDYSGEDRVGENLWTASTLALNYKTGAMAWGYQEVHHDIWDFDSAAPTQVIDVEVNGKMVEGVAETNKDGYTYFENAATGEPIFPTPEKPVPQAVYDGTFPTEPIPTLPNGTNGGNTTVPATVLAALQATVNEQAATKHISPVPKVEEGGIEGSMFAQPTQPGEPALYATSRGGPQFQDSSFDASNGYYYVCQRVVWQVYLVPNEVKPFEEGKGYSGVTSISASSPSTNTGTLTAYNLHTGQIAWSKNMPTACVSGTTTTAGNLLIVGGPAASGELMVYNATTGEELWKFGLGAGATGGAAVYEWGGKERIAYYAAGNDLQKSVHGDNLWQFSLEGTKGPIALEGAGPPGEVLPGSETR